MIVGSKEKDHHKSLRPPVLDEQQRAKISVLGYLTQYLAIFGNILKCTRSRAMQYHFRMFQTMNQTCVFRRRKCIATVTKHR